MKVGDIVKTRPGYWPVVVCLVVQKEKGILNQNTAKLFSFKNEECFWESCPEKRFEVVSKKLA